LPEDELGELEAEGAGEDEARIEDALLVEVLMGWDGDRCACVECDCPRFRDQSDETRCLDCLVGQH
jgi:hypothetical protein